MLPADRGECALRGQPTPRHETTRCRGPRVVAPGAGGLQHRRRHGAGCPVQHQRLHARHTLGGERGNRPVAAVLTQQGDAEPQCEMRLVGPGLCEMPGEQRATLGSAGGHDATQHRCRIGDVVVLEPSAEQTPKRLVDGSEPRRPQRLGRGSPPHLRHHCVDARRFEVEERGDHHLGRHSAHRSGARTEVAHHPWVEPERRVVTVGFRDEVDEAVVRLEPLPQEAGSGLHVSRPPPRPRAPSRGTPPTGTPTSGSGSRCRTRRRRGCVARARTSVRPRRPPPR